MNCCHFWTNPRRSGFARLTLSLLALTVVLVHGSPAWAAPRADGGAVDLNISAARFPGEDAIILRWEQHWTLEKDGTVHRRDHRWVKLLNSRPIRRYADPRVDFVSGEEKLIIHTAQTHLPDGTILPVPDYSFNASAPGDVGRWPGYADWQQKVISFSGIEDGAVVELDYEVVTPPGVLPWIQADLRLHVEDPTVERVVRVTLPKGTILHHRVDGVEPQTTPATEADRDGAITYAWTFKDLASGRGEPQSLPWQQRCGRLRFTTCPNATTWVTTILDAAKRAAQPADTIKRFAKSVVEEEREPGELIRLIAKKLIDSFNHVRSWKARRSLQCRTAEEVLRANYGNDLEGAALSAAALKSLGLSVSLVVAVDARTWDEEVPTSSGFAGLVAVVELPGETVYVHPPHGVIHNPGSWGRHRLLSVDDTGNKGTARLKETYIRARGERMRSELHVSAKIAVDKEAKATGELRIRLTGAFFDPTALDTAKAQKAFLKGIVQRVLLGFTLETHSVVTLSEDLFRATVNVSTSESIHEVGAQHVLRFSEGPAFLKDFPLPLGRSHRRTVVDVGAPFLERIDVTVELPDGFELSVVPQTLPTVEGEWGAASQEVEIDGRTITIRRTIDIRTDRIDPEDFTTLREAINRLRTTQSLLLAFRKK